MRKEKGWDDRLCNKIISILETYVSMFYPFYKVSLQISLGQIQYDSKYQTCIRIKIKYD